MLQVLTIETPEEQTALSRMLSPIHMNSLKVIEYKKKGITVRNIRYINRNGRINWKRIKRHTRNGQGPVLYSSKETIPDGFGFDIFEPENFRMRLCINMCIEVLNLIGDIPKTLKIGLYDPLGEHADMAEYLLNFTDNIWVVTDNTLLYSEQSRRILWETGAVLRVCRSISALSCCGLIISLCKIPRRFTPMNNAVILTSGVCTEDFPCRIYNRYYFCLPEEFEGVCPAGLDTECFAGALYSLLGYHGLGSLVPYMATGSADAQTCASLSSYFCECFGT